MSHRIDIELTSASGEGWTWRAAGARQPKGTVEAALVYEGARVGDVVRAEAERTLDGATEIVSIKAPKAAQARPETLEIIAPVHTGPDVNVIYAESSRGSGPRRDGRDGGPRRDRPERGDRPPRGDRPGFESRGPRPDRPGASPRPGPSQGPRPERADRPTRTDRPVGAERPPRADRPARPAIPQSDGARAREKAAKTRKLTPSRTHRDALLESLPVEQRLVAEQLLRGGIPAVRQAIIDHNAELRGTSQPEMPAAPLLAMADALLPKTKQADWLDHAQAALDIADDITLRDLRAVVTQADGGSRDDASREMAAKLREALQRRIEGERVTWNAEIGECLEGNRLVRALRLAGRLPDPGAKIAPELHERLVTSTNAQLSADTPQDLWATIIEAAADAPFRREIAPVALPTIQGEAFAFVAAQASNRIPSLLKLLGLSIPPPPRAKVAAGSKG